EESPEYSFEASSGESSRAEAGAKKPGDSQSYYYRYLGSLQCAKERVMMTLQPFITGSPYTPYAYDCFPELIPPPGPGPIPPQNQWLQWPCAGAYVEDERLSVCYKDPRRSAHAGLDLQCPGGIIYPSAPGKVVAVNNSPGAHGFGIYVIIDHGNGWFTLYAHLQSASVSVGKDVGLNTPIGRQDNTGSWSQGSHLHLGLAKGGSPSNFLVSGPTADPCAATQGCSCSP
ncbi:MAG: M23 family metallopeptidase, partial [Candidatus Beckwithbacteria bacterium]|nr:M23 family metallopeptidase [Candidatus Beckwithbacteria bacterium]